MLLKDMNIVILFRIFGKGKDAAVAYDSYDFKFVNNTKNTIKISATNSANYVTLKLFKIE